MEDQVKRLIDECREAYKLIDDTKKAEEAAFAKKVNAYWNDVCKKVDEIVQCFLGISVPIVNRSKMCDFSRIARVVSNSISYVTGDVFLKIPARCCVYLDVVMSADPQVTRINHVCVSRLKEDGTISFEFTESFNRDNLLKAIGYAAYNYPVVEDSLRDPDVIPIDRGRRTTDESDECTSAECFAIGVEGESGPPMEMVVSMEIDDGELDGCSPAECFVLGVEWEMVRQLIRQRWIGGRPIHAKNRERIVKLIDSCDYNVDYSLAYMDEDRSESYMWLKINSY